VRPALLVPLLVLACVLTGCGGDDAAAPSASPSRANTSTASTSPESSTSPGPTNATTGSSRTTPVTKVLVVVEENHSLDQMSAGMPYTFGLAKRFGYATHYTAIRHPSLPNYVAIAGGGTFGITDDAPPADHPIHAPSVFGRAIASGHTAALYAEGMPRPCAVDNGGGTRYAVKHNPWAYFVDERTACDRHDLPAARLGTAIRSGQLPNVGMVIPDLCNDAHDCDLSDADTWFRGLMGKVFTGQDWKSGRLAVVLTADEDEHDNQGNTVLTMVLHRSQQARVVDTPLTHYSLSGLLSAVTGTRPLGEARTAPSMAAAFELPLARG
jgi:hypothetical protein